MKKILFTIATDAIKDIAKPFLANHQAYATRNNYEYAVKETRFDGAFFRDNHPSFSKVPYALEYLSLGYDAVIYADSDVAFIDQGVDLFNLINNTDYWMGAYHQQNWPEPGAPYLNAGLFVVKQRQRARAFFEEWMQRCVIGCPDWRPGKITPILDFPWENWHYHGLCKKHKYAGIRCCNAQEIGCFCPDIWHDGVIWNYKFPAIHFAGQMATWERRAALFQEKYARFVR